MRLSVILCVLLLLVLRVNLRAEESSEFLELRQQAAKQKDLKSYSGMCRFLYMEEKRPELLVLYADSIRQLAFREKSVDCFIEYYSWISEVHFMKGNYSDGYALKRKALKIAERTGKKFYIADCSSNLGYYFNVETRYDSARYYLNKGMMVTEKIPELASEYRTMLTNYASSFLFEGKTDSALIYTLRAEKRSVLDKDTAMLIENLNQLGSIYRRKKNLDACVSSFERALQLCEIQHTYRIATYIYGNIATVYSDWNRSKDALPFSKKAVEYALEMGTPQMIGICYVNLGAIQCNITAMQTEGIATLHKAIPFLTEVNNKRRLCEAYTYLVGAYRKTGDLRTALIYLNKLDEMSGELQTDVERYRYYQAKAALLQASGNYAQAIEYYLKLTDMFQKGYLDARDYEHYAHLAECYKAINSNDKAYDYLLRGYALRDSSYMAQYTEQLSNLSVKYKTKEQELEITQLKQQELENKAELLQRRVAFGTIVTIMLIVLLILLYARQRQKVRLAELAQAAANKESQFLTLQKETEERLTHKYIDGLESERERMATELHDDVCNSLLALEMNLQSLPEAGDGSRSRQLALLGEARERLRNISHELMPPAFQYATIDEMLADYVAHLALPKTMQTEYESTDGTDWMQVPQNIGFEFYRIVQEAVGNAVKYSEASHVKVNLALEENTLSVLIADDGKGFDPSRKTKGIGLRTICQRVQIVGGQMDLDARIGNGVRMKISVLI